MSSPPPDTVDTSDTIGTNGITTLNGTSRATNFTATFHKQQKWLIDKKHYIVNVLLILALLILLGIFMVFGRSHKNLPGKVSVIEQPGNVENGSGEYSTASSLIKQRQINEQTVAEASNFSSFPTNTATTTATASATTNSGTIKGQSFDATQCIVPVANNKCQEIKRENSQNDGNIVSEDTVANVGDFMGWYPKHYDLNISIHRDARTSFAGNVSIYMKAVETTSSISLHVGRSISDIALSQLTAYDCRTGELFCALSIVYHQKDEVLSVEFPEPIPIGHIIVLQIKHFSSPQAPSGLIVKRPQKWEPKRPWTVTTFFQLRNARTVFPCFDLPNFKATMKMCISHPNRTEARSNTKIISVSKSKNRMETCFDSTPPLSSYLYAFTIFDRMSSMKEAGEPDEHLPEIEVLYSEEDNFIKPDWIATEAIHALKVVVNITDYQYPLSKLNLMATSLPIYGLEHLGLIILDERFVAYPKYRLAHTILAHEIAQQWIGNIVTVKSWKEVCLQEGLSTYLEWLITKSLDNSTEIDELISEKRREGIMKDSTTSAAIISEFRSPEDISRCFDKPAIFFIMLELGFGQGSVARMIKLLLQRYAYTSVGLVEWRGVIEEAANDVLAGEFFEKYFTQPGLPLIRVSLTAEGLKLTQSVTAVKQVINGSLAIIPMDVAVIDVSDRTEFIVKNEIEMISLKHNGLMILDPDRLTHTIIVYEPEVYQRFVQCLEEPACSEFIKSETMRRIADDFCWAFLGNHFTIPAGMPEKARIWVKFMEILSRTKYVNGSCACCMNKNLDRSGAIRCSWYWEDVCDKLTLLKQIQQFV